MQGNTEGEKGAMACANRMRRCDSRRHGMAYTLGSSSPPNNDGGDGASGTMVEGDCWRATRADSKARCVDRLYGDDRASCPRGLNE